MRKFTIALALTLLASVSVHGQDMHQRVLAQFLMGETVSNHQSAEDVNVAIIVKYIGSHSSNSATIEVEAGGDLLFKEDAAVDASVECPAVGTDGTIDVSNAACNTLGEVVDIINADVNWSAVILDGLRTDTSDNFLLVRSATEAILPEGVNLFWDTDVADQVTFALTELRTMAFYVGGSTATNPVVVNPFRDLRAVVYEVNYNINFGTAGTLAIVSVDSNYRAGTETATTLYSETLTDNSETLWDRKPFGIMGKKGQKLLVRITDTGTIAGVTIVTGHGVEFRY